MFKGLSDGFLRMLSLEIKPSLYLPRQVIADRNEICHNMYYIQRGEVEVRGLVTSRYFAPSGGIGGRGGGKTFFRRVKILKMSLVLSLCVSKYIFFSVSLFFYLFIFYSMS